MDNYTEKAKQFLNSNSEDDNGEMNASIRNMAVGLTPTLLNFLGNRSAQMQMRGFQKANKFTQSLADEKGVEVLGNDGSPVIMPEGEAMFRQPYHKPEKSSLADPSNVQSTLQVFNKKTGGSQILTVLRSGDVGFKLPDGTFVKVDPRDIEKDYGIGTATSQNQKGEKTTKQYPKNKPETKTTVAHDTSLATHMGVSTEAEAKARVEQAEKAKEESSKIQNDIDSLKQSYGLVLTTNNPNTFAVEGFGIIKRAINDGKMSDKDLQNAMGSDYRSYFDEGGNFLEGKIKGGIPPKLRANFAQLIKDLIKKNKSLKESTSERGKRQEGLSKPGKSTLEGIVGGASEAETFEQKKNRLKSL